MAIRDNFPSLGSKIYGGESNGLVYTTAFFGTTLTSSYSMVQAFLSEQGYEDIPVPRHVDELRAFLLPAANQIHGLFDQPCYAHNPLRIAFVRGDRKRRKLILRLYNESAPNHLLRFHERQCPTQDALLLKAMEEELFERYGDVGELG